RYGIDPIAELVEMGADVLVNVAASPYTLKKRLGRAAMLAGVARHHQRPLVFVNQVGGNDDLIFDGASAVFGPEGQTRHRLPSFEPAFRVVDIELEGEVDPIAETDEAAALDALTLGVRDYARKCGFQGA